MQPILKDMELTLFFRKTKFSTGPLAFSLSYFLIRPGDKIFGLNILSNSGTSILGIANLWLKHVNIIDFLCSEVLNEYAEKVKSVIDLVLKAMEGSLSLEENCFSEKYGDGAFMAVRFNHSHPCPNPGLVLGAKAHSDGSGLTVLLPDPEIEGLQILKDGQWFGVPILSRALIVHAGDQMQIMSNDIFKSPIHRVIAPSNRARISVAIFYMPDPELEIGPVVGLITEERPRVYRDLRNYSAINFECFQKGETAIDAVKVPQS